MSRLIPGKNLTEEQLNLFQINMNERDRIICMEKCVEKNFRKKKELKTENRCLKNCHIIRSHLAFEFYNTLNEYTSHTSRPAKINN